MIGARVIKISGSKGSKTRKRFMSMQLITQHTE